MVTQDTSNTFNWLHGEDRRCFEDRLARLNWLVEMSSSREYWTSPGLLGKSLLDEARYCFVYGQFLATIVLGIAYIERTLSASLYAAGRNELERANFSELLEESYTDGMIDLSEFTNLKRIYRMRNNYAHFRRPGHDTSIESRAFLEDEAPHGVIEKDAVEVILLVLHIMDRNAI